MGRPRVRLRKPRGVGESVSALVVGFALLVLVVRVIQAAWPLFLTAGLALGAVGAWRLRRTMLTRRQDRLRLATLRITLGEFETMDDRQFEYALRDLLIRDGWSARRVGGGGDQGADVIGEHPQHGRIVVQAKHTRVGGKVSASVMYGVKGTAGPVHGADHAVVITNGTFTRDAMAWGDRHGIHWVDRQRLRQWAETGAALHAFLALPVRSSRRAA